MKKKQLKGWALFWAVLFLVLLSLVTVHAEGTETEDEIQLMPEESVQQQLDSSALAQSSGGESAVFGIAVMNKQKSVELSWDGNYTSVVAAGFYKNQKPSLVAAAPSSTGDMQVIEAWRVQNLKNNTLLTMTARLNSLPTLGEGESLAFYALNGGSLSADPLLEDLSAGDLATIQLYFKGYDGIALVRMAADPADLPVENNFIWANEDIYLTGKMPGNAVVDATPVTAEVDGEFVLAAYDVKIYTNAKQREKGKTWQPSDKKVQVHFFNEDFKDGQALNIYHMADTASQPQLVDTVTSEDNWITFEAESFSVYAITVIEKTVEASNGDTYKITVAFDTASGIPADAQVEAEEISTDSAQYKNYLLSAADALGVDVSSVVFSRLFDISLVGPDGTQYQPNDTVSVTIQLLEKEAQDVERVRVVHFADESAASQPLRLNVMNLNSTASMQDTQSIAASGSELSATTNGSTVTFDTDGFSMFALVDCTTKENMVSATFDGETVQKLYEDDNIIISGSMPPYGIVEAIPAQVQVEGENSLIAYDIKIYANADMKDAGINWQPSAGALTVQVNSNILENGKTFSIYHMKDADSKPEFIAQVSAMDHAVTFDASSFSIYPILDDGEEGENARIGYRFWYPDSEGEYQEITTEWFRKKDVENGLRLYTPSVPNMSNEEFEQIFDGWYKGTGSEATHDLVISDDEVVINKIEGDSRLALNDELVGYAQDPNYTFVEGTVYDIYAKFKTAYYITYVDVNPTYVLSTDLAVKQETGDTTFTPQDGVKPTRFTEKLMGWRELKSDYTLGTELYTTNTEDTANYQASYIIDHNMTLIPVIDGGYYLIYDDNDLVNGKSGGASYTPAVFYMSTGTDAQYPEKPEDPTWAGYEFGGWYTTAAWADGQEFFESNGVHNDYLTRDTVVYAKWIPSETTLRVVFWKQAATGKDEAGNIEAKYEYVASRLIEINPGTGKHVITGDIYNREISDTNVFCENGYAGTTNPDNCGYYTTENGFDGSDKYYFTFNSTKSDTSVVAKANGDAVLNVYYDRKSVEINYYTFQYERNNSGMFGLLSNGTYVRLGSRNNRTNVYYWTYNNQPYTGTYYTVSGSQWTGYTFTAVTGNLNYDTTYYGVINGYYRQLTRNEFTRGTNYRYSGSWKLYKTYTGLYNTTLEENNYTWPSEYWWYSEGYDDGSVGGTRTTFMAAFLPTEQSDTVNLYGRADTGSDATIRFYQQELDGTTYTQKEEVTSGAGTFYISDKYTGFRAAAYSTDNVNWTTLGEKDSVTGYYASVSNYTNLYIRFDRIQYPIHYHKNSETEVTKTVMVPFGTPLDSYASESPGSKTGYFVDATYDANGMPTGWKWYTDENYTAEYDFTGTMPAGPVNVYAKWIAERYRPIFILGATDVVVDPSQALTFRKDYGESVSEGLLNAITRPGYIFDGWHIGNVDGDLFQFDGTPMNSSVTGMDMTYWWSPVWAARRHAYGDDDGVEKHEAVHGALQIYARWILDKSKTGVHFIYDAGVAGITDASGNLQTIVPVDTIFYAQSDTFTVREAPTNYNDQYVFEYWEVVDAEGNVLNRYDALTTGVAINSLYDHYFQLVMDDETGQELRRIIKLRAHYYKKGDVGGNQTIITYHGNTFEETAYPDGTVEKQGYTRDGNVSMSITLDEQINETIVLPGPSDFYMDGYTLVGWSFTKGTYNDQVENEDSENAPNFMPGAKVAADNLYKSALNNYEERKNTLYAMWRPKNYTVTVKQVIEEGVSQKSFDYQYNTGVQSALNSYGPGQAMTNNSSFTVDTLSGDSTKKLEYWGRTGHAIKIKTPVIGENEDYSVTVSAIVTKDDGTRQALPAVDGDIYQILGNVEITYTYAPKVDVYLQKYDLASKTTAVTGAKFELTPVRFDALNNEWYDVGAPAPVEADMTGINSWTKKLQEGTYRIEETKVPNGYAPFTEQLLLTVRRGGDFQLRAMSSTANLADLAELVKHDNNADYLDTLKIYNRPERTFQIKKVVDGYDFEPADGYPFTVQMKLGGAVLKNYPVADGLVTDSSGIINVRIKHNNQLTLHVPWQTEIVITEKETDKTEYQYITTVSATEVADSNEDDGAMKFSFTANYENTKEPIITYTNEKTVPSPTGVDLRVAPYALMLLMGLALMMGLRYGKKRQMN